MNGSIAHQNYEALAWVLELQTIEKKRYKIWPAKRYNVIETIEKRNSEGTKAEKMSSQTEFAYVINRSEES